MQSQPIDIEQTDDSEIIIHYPVLKSFLVGSFSGTFSTILFQPLDLIKTRLQNRANTHVGTHPKNGMLATTISIIHTDNIFGLWRGITPSITRVVPGVGLYFATLHWLKNSLNLNEPDPFQAVLLGVTARTITGSFLIPITVVKTRYESGVYRYNSIGEALRLIYQHEGMKGLSSGLIPTLLRDAPYSGLYLMFYTQLKRMSAKEFPNYSNTASINFTCGIVAGAFASIVTQPADVIKTKMQLYPQEFKNVKSAFYFLYNKYGICGYFKGIIPRILRRTLMTAMAWTVYEEVTKKIGLR